MSVISPQVPARLRRALGRFVGPAGAALFSLVLASCAGGGFGGAGDASDISGVNPVSQPAPAASGPISPASQRKVAEAVSGLDLGEETPPISPEDIAVSNDSGILDSNPFSSSAPAARSSGWGARADSTRKTQGYKAFEVAVPSENPLMTVAVWISETPPDYPEGKPEQDPEADRKFLYLRLQVFIEVGHVALVEGGGVEVLDSEVIVVEEKRPDPKPDPQPTVVAEPLPVCGSREFRDGEGSCSPILGADLLCPSGTLLANGLTQAELDAGLISAARDNNLEGACEYLRRGASIEAQESEWRYYKRTALMIAATDGHLDLAKLLRANGADVNRQGGNYHNRVDSAAPSNGNRRMSALHYAAGAGHKDFVEWLLAEGADLHAQQTIERDALWEAAFWGRVDIVKLFLSLGADVNAGDITDATPFLDTAHHPTYWARHGNPHWGVSDAYARPLDSDWVTVLSLLVSSGADVNVRYNYSGYSALDIAVSRGNAEYAELLRGYGVRCFVQTGPLCGVVEAATPDPVTLEAVTSETVCESGSLSANGLTQAELDAGLLSEARDNDLAGACEYLRRGGDIEAQESEWRYHKRTALMIAATDGHLDLAKLLRANGADVNRQGGNYHNRVDSAAPSNGNRRMSALHYAAGAGHKDFVEWLLAEGADLHAKQTIKRDALWEAAFWGRVDIVKLFLSLGADVNARDVAGATPFLDTAHHSTYWARYGNQGWGVSDGYAQPLDSDWATVISLLVSHGTDVNVRYNHTGSSALDVAVSRGNAEYAELLRGYGVRCFVQTGPLCGAVHVAVDFSSSGSGTVSAEGGGGALSDGDDVRQGATVMFTATPAAGHYVSGWSGNCAEIGEVADGLDGTAKSCAVSADSDLSVRAEFSEIPSLAGPLCPLGSLSANGLTQAELDAGLVSAAQANNLEDVCEHLRRGASVEAQEQSGTYRRTALMIAAYDRYLDLAKLLHANGADVNSRVGNGGGGGTAWPGRWNTHADTGFTALMYAAGAAGSAAAAGRTEMVGWLLDNGADPNLGDSRGRLPLWEAAHYGRVEVMGLLLDGGADVDGADVWGVVPLQAAGPHYDRFSKWSFAATVVGYLLSRGAEVNARDIWGRSPLDVYAEWSHRNVAAVLRNAGGKCFVQTGPLCGEVHQVAVGFSSSGSGTVSAEGGGGALSDGDEVRQGATVVFTATPAAGYYVSGWSGNCAEIGEVADGLDGAAQFCAAAADSDLSVRAEFSEIPSLAGPLCPSGSLSANGLTQAQLDAGLVSAAQANNLEDVCEHLRRGASVEAQEQSGAYRRTALMIAAHYGHLELAKLLHANGADVNSRVGNGNGGGAPHGGRWSSHADSGFTALMYAAGMGGDADMVGWLLDRGADANLEDGRGRLPLWEAAHYGRVEAMKLLLDHGADADGADVWGLAPLHAAGPHYRSEDGEHAEMWYAAEIAGGLLSHGADVNARDTWGRSPLDVFAGWSHPTVAAVLRDAGGRCFVETGPLCGVDVAVDFSSSGSGTVSAEGDSGALSDGDEVRQGATVVFTAAPGAGHYVSGWSGNCADIGTVADGLDGTAKSCAVSADSDLSVRAEFSEIPSLAGPLCPSGSLSANGLTQAQLDAGLVSAAMENDLAKVCEHLRRGADVDTLGHDDRPGGYYHRSALMIAAAGGFLELAKLLHANGADLNIEGGGPRTDGGRYLEWTALNHAANGKQSEVAAWLLDNGVDVNRRWRWDRIALHDAAYAAGLDVVNVMLSRGADEDARDIWGWTPLFFAVAQGMDFRGAHTDRMLAVISALAAAGADVNAMSAANPSEPSYWRTQVDWSWGWYWHNRRAGRTPLDLAVRHGRSEYVELLRSLGGVCHVETGPLCGEVQVAVDFSSSGSGTVSAEGDGGALSDGGEVRQGATVMFTATPAAGHYVSGWSGNCADAGGVADGLDGTAKSCAVSADSDLSVRAEFSEIPSLAGPLCPSESLSANGLTTAELNMTLRLAARGGDAARACEALRRGAEVNDNLDDSEFTPLQEAVSGGHLDAVKLLLANGAEVNKRKDSAGHSPLDLAARDSEAEIAALLRNADGRCFLETGPLCEDVPVATSDPVTVVNTVVATVANTVAATVANTVAATVVADSCPTEPLPANGLTQAELNAGLLSAARAGNKEDGCEYLRRGADVNAKADSKWTALIYAAWNDSPQLAALLIDRGVNVNAQSKNGWVALHMAVQKPHIIRLLLENGANTEIKDQDGRTPLNWTAYTGTYEAVRELVAGGADVSSKNNDDGWAPLHYTARSNLSAKTMELLIANGADVNATTNDGETPLDIARRYGKSAIIAILEAAMDPVTVTVAATTLAAQADSAPDTNALTDRLRERFSGVFNPSPAFGDAFGAVSGSSERFLGRLDSLMRSSAGAGGSAWDSFGGWQRENEHGRMWFSTGQRGDFGFGAGGNGAGGDLSASPFAALAGNGMLAGGETGLGADGKLRIAAFADYQARSLLDGEDKQWTQWAARGTAIETAMTEAERFSGLAENQTRGAMTELHLGGGDLGVALQAGAVSESDAMLSGTAGDGENLRGLRSRTAFAGLSGAADLFGSGWRLRGSAHLGRSWAESEGMLQDGDLWASAFSAGLERGGWLYSDDGFVLRFSQPLRVESLEMGLIGEDGAGRLGADPSGRQLDVDAAYRLPLSGGGWLLLSAGVRRDGGHSSSSDLEAGALFSVERGF